MQTDKPTTLPRILAEAAHSHGHRLAVVDGDVRLSFAALQHEVLQAGAAFLRAGIGGGDRVALWAPNCWQWIVACLAAQSAGAAVVPLNTRLKGTEAAYILNRSRACCLISAGRFLGNDYTAMLEGERLPHLRQHVRLDVDWSEFVATGLDIAAARQAAACVAPDDACDILFTSGTTGQPKGVIATHAQTVRVFSIWAECVGLRAEDRYLIVNPFFHCFGYKAGWLACLLTGATAYPLAAFGAARVAELVASEFITVLPGPPTLFVSLLQDDRLRADGWRQLESLRIAVTGAANVPPALIADMRDDLGIDTVLTGYGLTESCGVVTMTQAGDDAETVARSCGRAIKGVEVRIAAPGGATGDSDAAGEILVRGYNVMRGYLDDPAATRAAIDAEGWLHTGDVGHMDPSGYLYITDRLKDVYISGGFNCYPAEIERLLSGHPDIAQAAVIGLPDARLGEVGMAFVVPKAGAQPDAAAVSAWARANMANYKVPRIIRVVPALPVNASGKVMKATLRQSASL